MKQHSNNHLTTHSSSHQSWAEFSDDFVKICRIDQVNKQLILAANIGDTIRGGEIDTSNYKLFTRHEESFTPYVATGGFNLDANSNNLDANSNNLVTGGADVTNDLVRIFEYKIES